MHSVYVVGAGGIGCAVGYALAAAGLRVVFIEADGDKIAWGRAHGVQVDHRPPRPAEFLPFADWSPRPGATVLLCTKCFHNPVVLDRLPVEVDLIPIQNGFDPALETKPPAVEGIASFVSECYPGRSHTRITRAGRLHFGARRAGGDPAGSEAIRRLRGNSLFRVELVADILPYKYTKLMYNAAISPLAAAAGIDNGRLLSVPKARRLFFALLRENYAILHGAGIPLARIGPFHPATVQRILRRRSVAQALAWAFYPTLRGTYCSMSADLPAGRTEIESYNGHLIGLAADRPCPLNRAIYDLVKRMERDRIAPHVGVLDEIAANV
ncbi:MAG TPA: ketopantoate reductase C-terminal domain-containing protein [Pirellulales bacterium]|nr:ketopantoate reductase C-terminal domain-containing protein [Pirellulales bacterium]